MKNRNQLVYISGPMSGQMDYNFSLFQRAEEFIRGTGNTPFNPHKKGLSRSEPFERHMSQDLNHVLRCDAICLLPSWEMSAGALAEVHAGLITGKEFFFFSEDQDPTLTDVISYPLSLYTLTSFLHTRYCQSNRVNQLTTIVETPVTQIFLGGKKHSGKSTIAAELARLAGAPIDSFAAPLKRGVKELGFEVSGPDKNVPLLQYLGTDLVRESNPNHWIDLLFLRHPHINQTGLIVDDVRFANEAEFGKRQKFGFTVYLDESAIVRARRWADMSYKRLEDALVDVEKNDQHSSEQVDPSLFDLIIECAGKSVEKIVKEIYQEYVAYLSATGRLSRVASRNPFSMVV